jgi:hypothetical protein
MRAGEVVVHEVEGHGSKLQEQEDAIKRQRSELRSRSAELTKSLNVYKELMGIEVSTPAAAVAQSPVATIQPSPGNGQGTIADMAYHVIAERGGTMSTNDIVAELQARGKLKGGGETGRGDYGTVYRTLLRDGRFIRSDRGVFSLAPPHPSAPAPPSEQSPDAAQG